MERLKCHAEFDLPGNPKKCILKELAKSLKIMKLIFHNPKTLLVSTALFFSGCASIVSKSNWPFSVDTDPPGANVIITNKKGTEIFTGKTPTALKLKSGAGFFSKESYTVTLSMDGYEIKKVNVECKLNAWYFGNIILGGLIGMLIVDPATGAMYKLDNDGIFEKMAKTESTTTSLIIMNRNQAPKDWEQHLIKIN